MTLPSRELAALRLLEIELDDPTLPVDLGSPGEHEVPVRVRTPYGMGRTHFVRHLVR